MNEQQLQTLRSLGNEAEEAADEIVRLRAALAMSPKQTSGTSLPPPDMTMPSIAPDGPEGSHYYRASTVRRLIENKGESA